MLHTVNKSPFEKSTLDTCLRLAKPGSTILLIEDGVYAVMQGTSVTERMANALRQHSIYVLGPDLKARGLEQGRMIDGVKVVDYGGFVDLVAQYDQIQTWF